MDTPASSNLMMSSLKLVPPVVTITLTLVCLASSIQICDVCSANSLVGTNTRAVRNGITVPSMCEKLYCTHTQKNPLDPP